MKILHVIGNVDKKLGGTYSALFSIMTIENLLGHTNIVVSTQSKHQQYDDYFRGRIHLFERSFPARFRFSKTGINWLKQNIKDYKLVVIHEVWGGLGANAALVAKKKGVKYIIWPHGSLDPFDLRKKSLLKRLLGRIIIGKIIENANAICCTSSLERKVLETYKRSTKRIEVLFLPIDYNEQGISEDFRTRYSITKDSFVFLFLSRIDYKKGLDIFLIALSNFLKTSITDIRLVIAGSGSKKYGEKINKIIRENNLSHLVVSAGFLSGQQKADAYAGSDCFVLTSMNENYGISTIEALQAGLPVLISKNIYIWEAIMPEGGWVCEYSVSSIETSIAQIINAKEKCTKEPAKVGHQFTTNSLLNHYKRFYNSLGDIE